MNDFVLGIQVSRDAAELLERALNMAFDGCLGETKEIAPRVDDLRDTVRAVKDALLDLQNRLEER